MRNKSEKVLLEVQKIWFRVMSLYYRSGKRADKIPSSNELAREFGIAPTPVRLLSVTALYITDSADSYQQLDLLAGDAPLRDQRQEQLESAMDAIRGKYGRDAITFGRGGKAVWNKDE